MNGPAFPQRRSCGNAGSVLIRGVQLSAIGRTTSKVKKGPNPYGPSVSSELGTAKSAVRPGCSGSDAAIPQLAAQVPWIIQRTPCPSRSAVWSCLFLLGGFPPLLDRQLFGNCVSIACVGSGTG